MKGVLMINTHIGGVKQNAPFLLSHLYFTTSAGLVSRINTVLFVLVTLIYNPRTPYARLFIWRIDPLVLRALPALLRRWAWIYKPAWLWIYKPIKPSPIVWRFYRLLPQLLHMPRTVYIVPWQKTMTLVTISLAFHILPPVDLRTLQCGPK